MGKKIVQLENLLTVWEDQQFLLNKLFTVEAIERMPLNEVVLIGPAGHYDEFRQHLVYDSLNGTFDYKRFVNSEENIANLSVRGAVIAPALFSWNRYSRRVFHLTRDLQTLLSATSLEGINWNEVRWPFRSFLLMLDEPLEDETGGKFSSILVSEIGSVIKKIKHTVTFSFLLLSENLENYKPLDRFKISKQATLRKWNKDKMVRKLRNRERNFFEGFIFTTSDETGKITGPVTEPLSFQSPPKMAPGYEPIEIPEDVYIKYSLVEKAKHLVVSTCLYLASLPPKQFPDDWQPAEKERELNGKLSPASITTADGIFKIVCDSILSKESQETITEIKQSRISREKRPHWRRGHWRRIWGGRNNNNAPKIWILPCLVNKQRLSYHSLPIASRTILEE